LTRCTETQPSHVGALDAWLPTPTPLARLWRRTWAAPWLERLHEQ
jgi:hypothetical protein